MNTRKTFTVTLLLTILTAGCGGGGSSGGDEGVTLEPLVIDRDNAMLVTAAVLDAVSNTQDLEPFGVVAPATVAAAAIDVDTLPSTLAEIIRRQINRFSLPQATAADFQIAAVVIPPTTTECAISGTMTISGTIADETGTFISPGDTLNASFTNCNDGDGDVADGDMAIEVVVGVDFNFTPPYDFTFDVTLINFSTTEIASGETFTGNGDLTLREAVTADALFIETEVSGTKLTVTLPGDTLTLKDYWIQGTSDLGLGDAYTADSSGRGDCCATLESTVLGGTVDFRNTQPFEGVGDDFPYAGVLFITGALAPSGVGNTSVELTALDELCVDLLIDENGDGAGDVGITTTWESLPTGIAEDCVL
ncbi:MAG: hypothetical protein U9P00_11445 [Pseudomonadota bacterium]|nr:hypothetical protein [Pseudomonadota bacterium]